MEGGWQHQIYLATIDRLDDYYDAKADHIIKVASIDEDGYFTLEGDNLPDHPQFYRLYLIKEEHSEFNACLFEGGEEHNFVHLLLANDSELEIIADTTAYAPFGNYRVDGDWGSHLMRSLGALVYPSYIFYEIRFPSELKFSQDKLNRDLFNFADSCSNTLVSLAAMVNTDFDVYFEDHQDRYRGLADKLEKELPEHPYTRDYLRKMRYYGDDLNPSQSPFFLWMTVLLSIAVVLLWLRNRQLMKRLHAGRRDSEDREEIHFTPQEIRILQFIAEGKTNKDIASELFIELSTVKSHINKLYAKLKVKNRREAIIKAKQHAGTTNLITS